MKKWSLAKAVTEIKKAFPLPKPVTVSVRKLNDLGSCHDGEDRIYISISKSISLSEKKDTLIHEWAHGRVGWTVEPHTQAWGIEYAKICRWWYSR